MFQRRLLFLGFKYLCENWKYNRWKMLSMGSTKKASIQALKPLLIIFGRRSTYDVTWLIIECVTCIFKKCQSDPIVPAESTHKPITLCRKKKPITHFNLGVMYMYQLKFNMFRSKKKIMYLVEKTSQLH